MITTVLFGFMSAAAVWLAALSYIDRKARTIAATFLMATWALSSLSLELRLLWPIMDATFGTLFILWWIDNPRSWKIYLFWLFLMQSLCHAAYHIALAFGGNVGYCYTAALNALFVCQLLVVSSDGIKRGRGMCVGWVAGNFSRALPDAVRAFLARPER